MTFKSLINGNGKAPWDASIERYHNDEGGYHHGYRGNSKGKGGSSAALSALTLLAFLFLLNVMQQSLQDNNSTLAPTATTLLLRDTEMPIVLDNGNEKNIKIKDDFVDATNTYDSRTTIKDYA
ncbi:hypothetical protein EAG_01652 [Camponotus floridanus]|uniref:Uncharacterized protein n=1 Tax=Camponotus floridanus TaxID=104421 RepID=E2AW39_CAMFO|nr:uncharacterized protein LOC105256667 [Camponotus floridanus]EFN62461.1 hypothetical protein EAG_01652 [Camponotus floridanus]